MLAPWAARASRPSASPQSRPSTVARARAAGVAFASCSPWIAPAGAAGMTVVPYLEGERTPDRPDATGAIHGLQLANATPAALARATVEGLLCGLADGLDALAAQGASIDRVVLVGGGARSDAVCRIAPSVFGQPVLVPAPGAYVADRAA